MVHNAAELPYVASQAQYADPLNLASRQLTWHALQDSCDPLQTEDAETVTQKWGLEAGLWKVFTSKDNSGKSKGQQAKDLLTRYGSAYLITSISFALVSFGICYALVNSGMLRLPACWAYHSCAVPCLLKCRWQGHLRPVGRRSVVLYAADVNSICFMFYLPCHST